MNEENNNLENNITEKMGSVMPQKEESSMGAVVGAIIVIVVIVIGGLYFLSQRVQEVDSGIEPNQIRREEDQATLDLMLQNPSDEIADIEADLVDTDLSNLDQELGNIEAELSL